MTKALRLLAVICLAAIVLTMTACGSELTGRWHSTSEKRTELNLSATGRAEMSADGITLTGTYEAKDGYLVMSLLAPNGEVYVIEATYELTDDYLYLENSKGQVEVFTR